MRIGWECRLFACVCALDMVSTAWLVSTGRAVEANPVMDFYLARGIFPFLLAKSMMCIAPLFALEILRPRRPEFVRNVMCGGLALYVMIYAVGICRLNLSSTTANAVARARLAPRSAQLSSGPEHLT